MAQGERRPPLESTSYPVNWELLKEWSTGNVIVRLRLEASRPAHFFFFPASPARLTYEAFASLPSRFCSACCTAAPFPTAFLDSRTPASINPPLSSNGSLTFPTATYSTWDTRNRVLHEKSLAHERTYIQSYTSTASRNAREAASFFGEALESLRSRKVGFNPAGNMLIGRWTLS